MVKYCEYCNDEVEITLKEEENVGNIKGKEIKYIGKEAFCKECKQQIFVHEIRDYNLQMLDKAFRELEGLITIPEMEKILEVYNIGKKPLSLLLGWGEVTLVRYLNGDTPSKQYSDILKKVLGDTGFVLDILERNKDNITEKAYQKCFLAIQKLIKERSNNSDFITFNKIESVVKYLLEQCTDITPLAIQKLLYYSQGFSKVFNDRYLFNEDCEAWIHGPVYRNVYYKLKQFGCEIVDYYTEDSHLDNLANEEIDLLNSIISSFGCYSGKTLEQMTHLESPWRYARRALKDSEVSNRIIEKDSIFEYFNSVKQKYNMLNISDIKDYSMNMFNKLTNFEFNNRYANNS